MSKVNSDIDEIWEEIEKATDDIEVPDSLLPENIIIKLKERKKKEEIKMRRVSEMAAVVALTVMVGGVGSHYLNSSKKYYSDSSGTSQFAVESTADAGTTMGEIKEEMKEMEESVCETNAWDAKKKKAKPKKVGDAFHIAKDYEEIYSAIETYEEEYEFVTGGIEIDDIAKEPLREEVAAASGSASTNPESAASDLGASNGTEEKESGKSNSFSSTNVQEEGIDESDIVKTDGKYIYRVWRNKVYIADIQNKKMKAIGNINLKKNVSDIVKEIYLDGDKLCVVTECRNTNLNKNSNTEGNTNSTTSAVVTEDYEIGIGGFYLMDTKISTKLSVYNVKNKKNPVLEGEMEQDGSYYTSRKVKDMVYLFTNKNVNRYVKDKTDLIPYVQGEKVEADCIYIPEKNAYLELIAVSCNMNQPKKVVDKMVVMSSYAEVYMGQNAFYLYERDYSSGQEYTNIAKFSYDSDGNMYGVNATSIKGSIEDTFAISEKNNSLRILTTDWSGSDRVNQLYILDNNLGLKSEIDDIAEGESIYAARYIGNMAYFITYRNTDPLFVADLSDEKNPKLLGSVKISGFSDYLHPFGENMILGIGYETDEHSIRQGVKICMFDVSNPKKPKVLNSYVMKDQNNTPAAYNYKGVLVDKKRNMIGFLVENYNESRRYSYKIFSWKNGEFKEVFTKKFINTYMDTNEVRGLYSGNYFYIVKNNKVVSYDINNKYQKIDFLRLE